MVQKPHQANRPHLSCSRSNISKGFRRRCSRDKLVRVSGEGCSPAKGWVLSEPQRVSTRNPWSLRSTSQCLTTRGRGTGLAYPHTGRTGGHQLPGTSDPTAMRWESLQGTSDLAPLCRPREAKGPRSKRRSLQSGSGAERLGAHGHTLAQTVCSTL